MPRKAMARVDTAAPAPVKKVYGLTAMGKRRKELDDLGPIIRISRQDIITLRDLCATEGSSHVAKSIGIDEKTLLRAMAGLGDRCNPHSTEALRAFLEKLNS